MTLKRIPGKEIVAEFSLGSFWSNTRLDPNGYYRTLGLDPNTSIGMSMIKDHYRDLIKRYHPDGWEPNAELFEKVQIAYEILGDKKTRTEYDNLEVGQEWPDKFVLKRVQEQTRNLETLKVIDDLLERVVSKKKKASTEDYVKKFRDIMMYNEMVAQSVSVVEHDNEVMYYYEEEGLPDMTLWKSIIELVKQSMWSFRIREGVKIGYTVQPTHIVKKSWGEVLMINGDLSDLKQLVKCYLFPEHRESAHISVVNDV